MRIAITRPLFDWQSLEDSPTLASLRELLASIPDAQLLEGLAQHRGRGRDDYPVTVLWGVVVLTALLRHKDFEACLAELRRNEGLRQLIDIPDENRVPKPWNISRFMAVLGREPHRTRLVEIFDQMARRLTEQPDDPTQKRKPLAENPLAAWELRLGDVRVFYDVSREENAVDVLAVGVKERNRLRIGGEEVEL